MSDIFISYSHKDKAIASNFAQLFKDNGWTVFWDKQIPPGQTYDQYIKEMLEKSRCIVVLWSDASVASDWVKEEASRGILQSKLVPVLIDQIEPPLGFGRIEAAELFHWSGSAEDPDQQAELANLLKAISTKLAPNTDIESTTLSNPLFKSVGLPADPGQTGRPWAETVAPQIQLTPHRKQAATVAGALAVVAVVAAITTYAIKQTSKTEIPVTPPVTRDVTPPVTRDVTPPVTRDVTPPVTRDVNPPVTTSKLQDPPKPRTLGTISGEPGLKNLRSGPGTEYNVVKEVPTGDVVEILGSSTDRGGYQWLRVRSSDGVEAWIAAHLVTIQ